MDERTTLDTPITPPKLSTLMREGAKHHPKGTLEFGKTDGHGILHTCALGAAYTAYRPDIDLRTLMYHQVHDMVQVCGIDTNQSVLIPFQNRSIPSPFPDRTVINIITYLNDCTVWTREQIADWLESIGY